MKLNHSPAGRMTASVRRAFTKDSVGLTFDAAASNFATSPGGQPYQIGKKFEHRYRSHDGKFYDSTGAFMVGELERLDQSLHEPLVDVQWSRDIDLREDVTLADEVSSFTLSNFSSPGGLGTGSGVGRGKAWIGKVSKEITGVGLDIAKVPSPLRLWGVELEYSIPELESAAKIGRPIDQQKYEGMQLKHQMDVDEQVYIGDLTTGDTGLVNAALVTNVTNVAATGTGSSTLWSTKTPAQILADVNELLQSVWATSAYAQMPNRILVPPTAYGMLVSQVVSTAGSVSILKFLLENNLATTSGQGKLEIYPSKWCVGSGAGGTIGTSAGHDRMIAYTKDKKRVRFPMTPIQNTPVQFVSIFHKTTYFCRLGRLEVVYPETIGYRDEIS